jgi:hypothetical protein
MTKKKKFWRIKRTAYTSFDGLDRSQGLFFQSYIRSQVVCYGYGCVLLLGLPEKKKQKSYYISFPSQSLMTMEFKLVPYHFWLVVCDLMHISQQQAAMSVWWTRRKAQSTQIHKLSDDVTLVLCIDDPTKPSVTVVDVRTANLYFSFRFAALLLGSCPYAKPANPCWERRRRRSSSSN